MPAPTNATPPSISGGTTVGETITLTPGTWTPTDPSIGPVSQTHTWLAGATTKQTGGLTYVPDAGDVGSDITVNEVATDDSDAMAASAVSGSVGPIEAAEVPVQPNEIEYLETVSRDAAYATKTPYEHGVTGPGAPGTAVLESLNPPTPA